MLLDFKLGLIGQQLQSSVAQLTSIQAKLADRYEFSKATTYWNGGTTALDLVNTDVVIINATFADDSSSALHADDHQKFQELMTRGGAIFVMVGGCRDFHLENLIGFPVKITASDTQPNACKVVGDTPFTPLFATYGNRIQVANVLNLHATPSTTFLRNSKGATTGFFVPYGKGLCTFMPCFGEFAPAVVESILDEVLPALSPHLSYDDKFSWLTDTEYLMPAVANLRKQRSQAKAEFDLRDAQLKTDYELQWNLVQVPWNELLTLSGKDLQRAIKRALEAFGFTVRDVDEYLKSKGVSNPEEDLWIADGSEANPAIPGVLIGEIKSSARGTTKEDDYSQLIKYMNRRKTEHKNSELRGLLVINHSYMTPASLRPNAFSEAIVRDSMSDGVVLATTWDLFRVGQKLLSGTISTDNIRAHFKLNGELKLGESS